MPSPMQSLPGDALGRGRAWFPLASRKTSGLAPIPTFAARRGPLPSHSRSLARIVATNEHGETPEILLVPVSILVGRAPERAKGWLSALFAEDWVVGPFRRIMGILVNGRDTHVHFASAIRIHSVAPVPLTPERTVRKLARVLRLYFRNKRTATVGPDRSTRRLLVNRVLTAESVRAAVVDQASRDKTTVDVAWDKARRFAYEIAADYSHTLVRSASFMLTPFWNRIYRGVTVNHLDTFKARSSGYEVVYVPSHRSTMDDLLLPYLLTATGWPPRISSPVSI